MFRNLLLFITVSIFVTGCSTKVELNTEWHDTTIIFGLLDQNENYHYVKINKAFLGGGNYYDYALIRDSSEYPSVNAIVEELMNGVIVNTYTLRDTELLTRSTDGVFYAPAETVYYFKKTGLNSSSTYRIVANINEGTPAAKEVTAETSLIETFTIVPPTSISVGSFDGVLHTYPQPSTKFTPPTSSDNYEIIWRMKWDEYTATDTTRKTYEWLVGKSTRSSILSSGLIDFQVNGEAFYKTLASAIPNNPLVTKRIFRAVDIVVYASSNDLDTYISVNAPQSGLVQERPEFTNITNGLGLFSSRIHMTVANKFLTLGSTRELVHGTYTSGLLFCTDTLSPIYTGATAPFVICP